MARLVSGETRRRGAGTIEDDGYSVGRPDLDPSTWGCRDQEASATLEVFALTKERILITAKTY